MLVLAYSSGALASSWQSIGAARYYFDPQTFAMSKGRRDIDGNIYFFGDYGLANGWCNDGADWYYCSDGIACTGWKLVDGAWYYLDPASDGKMSVGYLDLGDAAYYLKPDGAMAVGWLCRRAAGTLPLNLARLLLVGIRRVRAGITWMHLVIL